MEMFLIVVIVFIAYMVPKAVDAHILKSSVKKAALVALELKERLARELKERLHIGRKD